MNKLKYVVIYKISISTHFFVFLFLLTTPVTKQDFSNKNICLYNSLLFLKTAF